MSNAVDDELDDGIEIVLISDPEDGFIYQVLIDKATGDIIEKVLVEGEIDLGIPYYNYLPDVDTLH